MDHLQFHCPGNLLFRIVVAFNNNGLLLSKLTDNIDSSQGFYPDKVKGDGLSLKKDMLSTTVIND